MIKILHNQCLLSWFDNCLDKCGIIHSCNCFHTMGGGIAFKIKDKFPQAYQADLKTPRGDSKKMGTFSLANVTPIKFIYNLYGQYEYGAKSIRHTSYDALVDGLYKIKDHALKNDIYALGIPFNVGCNLGGGNWNIVTSIIKSIFDVEDGVVLNICKYPDK
jgi:O-acetyl-ADP-ribose deacetylase (regulator of RNase III)